MTQGQYRAYGLAITSDIALPDLEPDGPAAADLTIRRATLIDPLPVVAEGPQFAFSDAGHTLAWPEVGRFHVRGGVEIIVEPAPEALDGLLSLPLLGPVIALALHQRGYLVLHGSALDVGGRCAVFLGDKGAGKSTTAAAMIAAGHQLLTDDVVAIGGSPARVIPGYPQIKLTTEAAEAVPLAAAEAMARPHPDFPKERRRLTGAFPHDGVAPGAFYVLARGRKAETTRLDPGAALSALMRYSYITRFGDHVIRGAAAAEHFRQCASLAGAVRVARLETPDDLARLPEVVRRVEDDLRP